MTRLEGPILSPSLFSFKSAASYQAFLIRIKQRFSTLFLLGEWWCSQRKRQLSYALRIKVPGSDPAQDNYAVTSFLVDRAVLNLSLRNKTLTCLSTGHRETLCRLGVCFQLPPGCHLDVEWLAHPNRGSISLMSFVFCFAVLYSNCLCWSFSTEQECSHAISPSS